MAKKWMAGSEASGWWLVGGDWWLEEAETPVDGQPGDDLRSGGGTLWSRLRRAFKVWHTRCGRHA